MPLINDDERYRLLIESVTDYAIFMLDPDGIVTSWNVGAQRAKGYAAEEIIGRHFSTFYTEEDRERGLPARALHTALHEGRFEHEGWRRRKDGTLFWAHVVIDPIRTASGEHVGFTKITRDLTERKQTEEALRRSEQQFSLLIQSVTDYAIYMLDPEGRITNWNAGAERIKGYTRDEILGTHFSRFYTEEDRQAGLPKKALAKAAAEGRYEKEGWRVRKDGTRFWANVVIDAIRAPDGTLIGYAKVTRDVTERRNAQQELETAREALFQSQKMDALGQLTGGVAHDFNNLLMAILGSLEIVQRRMPHDPKLKRLIDNAMQAARRGTSLTQRLLAFARRQDLKPEPVDLPDLVRGMTELLERSLGAAITIETRFPLSLPPAQADANQLELALLNLAVNARDAMPEGGQIVIGAKVTEISDGKSGVRPGRYVCLSVADNGEGMDEATLARASDPFFTTKGIGKGTGLGLAMVRGLTEQSGGWFALTSRKKEGTTAELWFPAAASLSVERSKARVSEAADEIATKPLTVLAVDDDNLVLINTVAMLDDLGHRALQAESGEQALDILRREAVDLVITDQVMPQMTGAELANAIRAEWPGLPVVVATGYAELPPDFAPDLTKLAKPFSQRDLAEVLARLG